MSQIPSDPGTNDNRRRAITYDEIIAMFVAFLTLGSVLFWGLTRSGVNLFGNAGLFNLDDVPPVVSDLDSIGPLDIPGDIAGEAEAERDDIGFGVASNDTFFGPPAPSAERPVVVAPPRGPVTSQPATVPAPTADTPLVAPLDTSPVVPPKQTAQPAEEPDDTAATPVPLEASREAIRFQDVPDDYWAKPYIDALSERLVIGGLSEETFAPEQPVTRAQLASAIAQAFPLADEEAAIAFSDVEADYWAANPIDKAVKLGFMNGFPDKSFQPGLPVPRAQVLTALVTGLDAAEPENAQAIVDRYNDAAEIPDWAVGKMAAATQSELVVNHPNLVSLNPNQPATRAEVAAMIYQALAAQGRLEDIDGEYVVKP